MDHPQSDPSRTGPIPIAPRKTDLFAVFVSALTLMAVVSQVFLMAWLGSR